MEAAVHSVAIKCHDLDKMLAFYTDAFGGDFRAVDAGGMTCHFGRVAGVTLKLVPGRDSADFEGYPSHQLGLQVRNIAAVVRAAERHGGRQEGDVARSADGAHGCVRDPDGNTIELYEEV